MGFIEITGTRMRGGDAHEHIVEFRTVNRAGVVSYSTPAALIRWLEIATNVAVVYTPTRSRRFIVGPYRSPDGTRCLRAYTQSGWEDHLLLLPDIAEERSGEHAPRDGDGRPPRGDGPNGRVTRRGSIAA